MELQFAQQFLGTKIAINGNKNAINSNKNAINLTYCKRIITDNTGNTDFSFDDGF